MELKDPIKIKKMRRLIILVSVVIPIAVALLFKVKIQIPIDLTFLPSVYATINGLTALVLIYALFAIKNKQIEKHQRGMQIALVLSTLFLVLYVLYHMTNPSTLYGDSNGDGKVDILEKTKLGFGAILYYILLTSHILLSVAVVPLVLFTYLFAWEGNIIRHKKWNRYAFPIWLYVAISGVMVYILISPFY